MCVLTANTTHFEGEKILRINTLVTLQFVIHTLRYELVDNSDRSKCLIIDQIYGLDLHTHD